MRRGGAAFLLAALVPFAALAPGRVLAAEELTMLATVTRVVNLPMLVGFRLLEQDGIKVTVKDLKAPETVMLALIDGQGQMASGFSPFYPAVEKGAPVRAVMELSRPEFVVMAKKEIATVKALHGVRLASHSPKATVQSLLEHYLKTKEPDVKPNVVFIPDGSPARAEALLRGAVDAAAFDLTAAQVVNDRAPGKFHVLIDFTDQNVSSSVLAFNGDYAKKRPEIVQKVVRRVVESYRQGARDPKFWVRERGPYMKDVDDAKLEGELKGLVKVFDLNGGLDRMRGPGALENISFQVATGGLSAPASKWKSEQFFDTTALDAVLKEIGRQ
jgi:ABC-type nitrate/sulfonate/bicarbonate transport system substrate-binding protein